MGSVKSENSCIPLTHGWVIICCVSINLMLVWLSIDLIQTANQRARKYFRESHHAITKQSVRRTKTQAEKLNTTNYGSFRDNKGNFLDKSTKEPEIAQETDQLLSDDDLEKRLETGSPVTNKSWKLSLRFQGVLLAALLAVALLRNGGASCIQSNGIVWTCITIVTIGVILTYRDPYRERFGCISRFLYLAATLVIAVPMMIYYFKNRLNIFSGDNIIANTMGVYVLLVLWEGLYVPMPGSTAERMPEDGSFSTPKKNNGLSTCDIAKLLKPYVWPDETADSAATNRIRASMTWVCVIASKACNLWAPVLVS